MFWWLKLVTVWRLTSVAKNACLAKIVAVFKSFSVFPSNFLWLFIVSLNCSYPFSPCLHSRTSLLLHFFSKSSRKGMGLVFLISFSLLNECFFAIWIDTVFETFLSLCDGYGLFCLLIDFIHFHVEWSHCAFSLFWYLPVVDSENRLLNGFGIYVTYSFHLFVCWCWLAVLGLLCFMLTYHVWWHLQNIPLKQLRFLNVVSHCHVFYFECSNSSVWNFIHVHILCGMFYDIRS